MKEKVKSKKANGTRGTTLLGRFIRLWLAALFPFSFFLLPSLAPTGRAATISDTILKPDGSAFVGNVVFRPATNRVVALPPNLISAAEITSHTDTNGLLSQVLSANVYLVSVGGSLPFRIGVPDSTNTFTLGQVATNMLSFTNYNPGGLVDLGTKLTKTGDTIGGSFTLNTDITYDGAPGGGGGVWPHSEYHQNLANFELI